MIASGPRILGAASTGSSFGGEAGVSTISTLRNGARAGAAQKDSAQSAKEATSMVSADCAASEASKGYCTEGATT
eukprot:6362726-Prymnesium_polylepis.2